MTDREGNARTAVIGFMGARGAGITSLLGFIGGMAARAGAGRADARGCVVSINGVTLDMREYHLGDLGGGPLKADQWYFVADAESPGLDADFRGSGIGRFEGVFINKCDLIDFDDELIDLAMIETCGCLNAGGLKTRDTPMIAGSVSWAAKGERAGGVNSIAELLNSIAARI